MSLKLILDPARNTYSYLYRSRTGALDEIYRNYRIATACSSQRWTAFITHLNGAVLPTNIDASLEEGISVCLSRARAAIDLYFAYNRVMSDSKT